MLLRRPRPAARIASLLLATGLVAAACTGSGSDGTTTSAGPSDPSDRPSSTTTTAPSSDRRDPVTGPDAPPMVPDPSDVAEEAFPDVAGYTVVDDGDLFTEDARVAIASWLPDALVAGTSYRVLERDDGRLLAVSVIPIMQLRGDPNLVPWLAALESDGSEVDDGVYRTEADSGLVLHLWSSGDGFVAAAALDDELARRYLVALESSRTPLPAWEAGSCLYVDPDGQLPWAPFPIDAVVPCDGPHNAEVIASTTTLGGFDQYDDDDVAYERNLRCDRAFEEAMGPQRDHRATLITYMPDADEFARGDRYLACVVQLDTADGPALVSGRITARTDLAWNPTVGECFDDMLTPDAIECSDPHAHEFVAEVEFPGDSWPENPADAFRDACSPALETLTDGPADIDVFAMGLYPHAFEQGERSIRCMAFALDDDGRATVLGSFTGEWRTIGSGGVAA